MHKSTLRTLLVILLMATLLMPFGSLAQDRTRQDKYWVSPQIKYVYGHVLTTPQSISNSNPGGSGYGETIKNVTKGIVSFKGDIGDQSTFRYSKGSTLMLPLTVKVNSGNSYQVSGVGDDVILTDLTTGDPIAKGQSVNFSTKILVDFHEEILTPLQVVIDKGSSSNAAEVFFYGVEVTRLSPPVRGNQFVLPPEMQERMQQILAGLGHNLINQYDPNSFLSPLSLIPPTDNRRSPDMGPTRSKAGIFTGIASSVSGGPDAFLINSGAVTGGSNIRFNLESGAGPAKTVALLPFVLQDGGTDSILTLFSDDGGAIVFRAAFSSTRTLITYIAPGCFVNGLSAWNVPSEGISVPALRQIVITLRNPSEIAVSAETGNGTPYSGVLVNWVEP